MAKLTLNDLQDLRDRRVFVRVDFNVPLGEQDGEMVIHDDTRIQATLPTLRNLIEKGAKIILAAHLGRPKGKREPSLSLCPVAEHLGKLLEHPVDFAEDCIGEAAESAVERLKGGGMVLLENVRYHAEEEANDPAFSEQLAALADVYVNDAFGAAHRAHASTAGIAGVIAKRGGPCAAGLLMQRELQFLGDELESPARPFVVILGGAKVSDKIQVIDRLLEKANIVIIGGAMAYTFHLAMGHHVGSSLVESEKTDIAKAAMSKAKDRQIDFLLPIDSVVAKPVQSNERDKKGMPLVKFENPHIIDGLEIPQGEGGLDIGPKTIAKYQAAIRPAKTILWNGPMGVFEDSRFAQGTLAIAKTVAESTSQGAKSIIGGGDSVKALNKAGLINQVTFASTGGGASLEFLEGKELPGVAALSNR